MENKINNCLLIWPPSFKIVHLPLGIPFLLAYFKKNRIGNIEVFDLNKAYWEKKGFFHIRCTLAIMWYWYNNFVEWILCILKKISPGSFYNKNLKIRDIEKKPVGITEKSRLFLEKIPVYLHRFIREKMARLLYHIDDSIIKKEKETIPWSLKSILRLAFEDIKMAEKIYHILAPVIKENKFSLIGISAIYPEQLFFAFAIAKVIKENVDQNVRVVIGGAQVTKHIDYIINDKKVYDFVDFFITNDGEEPLAKLLKELPEKDFSDIPNLYFKKQNITRGYLKSKKIFYLHPKEFSTPDFKGFDFCIYRKYIPILASKGCHWSKCNFCTYAIMQNYMYCMNTIENTLRIIKEIKNIYGISSYVFVDDELCPSFLKRLATEVLREKLTIAWSASLILNRAFIDGNFCRLLKNAGLHSVSIGLESISPRILHLMNKYHKNVSELEIQEILTNLNNAGIDVGVHIIFGFPGEKIEEAQQTLNFLIKNRGICTAMTQPFCLEENTPVFNNPEKFGITKIYKEDKNSGYRLGYRYEVTEGMSQEEAEKFTQESRKVLK